MKVARVLFVVGVVICLRSGSALADLAFEIANTSAGSMRATVVLGEVPARWTRALRVRAVDSAAAASTTGLAIDDVLLETDAGVQTVAHAVGALPKELTADRPATVTLEASFTEPGTYRGEIVLRQNAQRRVIPLEVNVTSPAAVPLELEGGHAVATTAPMFGEDGISVVLQLRNKGHARATLTSVQLASVSRVDKPVAPSLSVQDASAALAASAALQIEAGAVGRVPVALSGIDAPGIYLVDVAVRAQGHEPEQVTVTVYRRSHVVWAILSIAAGALIAFGVRAFTTGGKARLELRHRLALLRDQLRGLQREAVEPDHTSTAILLGTEIDARERGLRWGGDLKAAATAVGLLELRVALFGEILAAARQLGRLDDARRDSPRTVLTQALAKVRIEHPSDEVTAARGKVADLALDEAWRQQLVAALGELDAQVSAQLARASASLQAAIVARAQPLQIAAHGALRQPTLDDAAARIKEAQVGLRALLLDELRLQVGGEPPEGVSGAVWSQTRDKINQLLAGAPEAPGWSQRFQDAQRAYFAAAIEGLANHAETKAGGNATDPVRLKAIAAELRSLLAGGTAGIDTAAALYHTRLREMRDASEPLVERRNVSADSPDRPDRPAWSWISVLLSNVPARGTAASPAIPRQIETTYRRTGWLVNGAVFTVAVLSGLKALWIGNLTWGTDQAWLIAFLWGAGITAVGDAVTAVTGLRARASAAT